MSSPVAVRDAATRLVSRITSGIAVAALAGTGAIVGLLAPPPAAPTTGTASAPEPVASPSSAPRVVEASAPRVPRVAPPRGAVVRPATAAPKRAATPPVATSGSS